ncbi:MAG: TerY-C metal binding domain-containing protein, partial [Gallionellaceae bacterium]
MKEYFRQVIFCSEVVGRSFLREILITDAMGQILDNEKLPPYFDIPLERLREQDEIILHLSKDFHLEGDKTCPFCGNRTVFYCRCGYVSCITPYPKRHVCPQCRDIFTKFGTCGTMLSPSGFVHGGEQRIPRYSGNN